VVDDTPIHPRPSVIAAAMYTLRDLDVDAIILHGPPGCNFRASRILEDDGVRVFTTSMLERDFIFGGKRKFMDLCRRINEKFSFKLIGVVGTCASMIIGEDLRDMIRDLDMEVILVETHGGFADNTIGAICTLEEAFKIGLISSNELKRQEKMLRMASEIERKNGMASMEYIIPSKGDNKYDVADAIVQNMENGEDALVILNAKKELGYIFSDILLAINELGRKYDSCIINIANLAPIGLPRIRRYATNIVRDLRKNDVHIDHMTGGLDEYPIAGENAAEIANAYSCGNTIVIGMPHAVPLEKKRISVTNGPREVEPLRKMGYESVVVELDAHSLVVGVNTIVTSSFGEILREYL
jgi:putative methanogenesis marker 13 metalloprotein